MNPLRAILVAVFAGVGVGLALLAFLALRPAATSGAVEIRLAGKRLVTPIAYIRDDYARTGGDLVELNLAADAGDFQPARWSGRPPAAGADPTAHVLFLSVRGKDDTIDPAERTERLYGRFLVDDVLTHPGGLLMRRFEKGSPWENEDLYFSPPEGRLFAARCTRPANPPDGLPNACIADIRIDGLDVQARFSPDLLPQWQHLAGGVRGLLNSMLR